MSFPHFLLILGLGFSQLVRVVGTEESCSLQPIQMQIRYRNCAPRNILLNGCSGHCTSYTQPNVNQPTHLERSCRCCRELGHRKVAVVLRCPNFRSLQSRRVTLHLRVPRSAVWQARTRKITRWSAIFVTGFCVSYLPFGTYLIYVECLEAEAQAVSRLGSVLVERLTVRLPPARPDSPQVFCLQSVFRR
ncbi:hypothetical protein ACOMHN_041676 [Nucella lapillus]